jgi:anthranilate synthase component 2
MTAWTDDGLVMATQHREWPRYGVQFHPESILTPEGPRIVENFLSLVG